MSSHNMAKAQILIAECDGIIAMYIESLLKSFGYGITAIVADGKEAVKKVEKHHPDLVLMDTVLKGEMDGIDAAEIIWLRWGTPVVFLTTDADNEKIERARLATPFGYLLKPFQERDLKVTIEMALSRVGVDDGHKQAEERQKLAIRVLEILNQSKEKVDVIHNILFLIKESFGIEAAGIRLRHDEDFPYYETKGFPTTFVKAERYLCERGQDGEIIRDLQGNPHLECMCGNVIRGRTDASLPFFSQKGSFWTNSTTEFLASTTEKDRQGRTRNRCNSEGYESVALIPLRSDGEIIGLLQLNDRRKDRFTLEVIEFFEGIGESIGIALTRKQAEETLKDAHDKLERRVEERTAELQKSNEQMQIEIDERGSAEKELQETRAILQVALEQSQAGIAIADAPDGKIKYINNAGLKIFGKSFEELACTIDEYVNHWQLYHFDGTLLKNDEVPLAKAIMHGKTNSLELIVQRSDKNIVVLTNAAPILSDGGNIIGSVAVFLDVTEAREAQQEKDRLQIKLQQTQKMEAIGTLAGGIAHDFNNILASVMGYTELAIDKVIDVDHNVLGDLKIVLQAAHRAKDLVHQILQFSRHTDTEFKPLEIGLIVNEALKLLRASIPATIEIKQKIEPLTEKVLADGSQIHQIVMNLCTNASHAMQKEGGVLSVELFKQEVKAPLMCHGTQISPGTYAVLMINDTGCGMDDETLQRIFEPYFSTKASGEGTGLGLAVTNGIVKNHQGGIRVESTAGVGSVFTLYFPLITVPEAVGAQEIETVQNGNECILFLDDEEFFVDYGAQVLTGLGYDVITANESLKALEIFTLQPDRFDLVITDQTMPKMTGLELSQKLHAIRPDLPIIICTGFSEVISGKTAEQIGVSHILYKPTTWKDLALAVRKVLDNGEYPDN